MEMIYEIVKTLIEELREMPNGSEETIGRLVSKCGYDVRQLERDDQMLTIYSELLKAARKAHITLDWSAYKDMPVGLPYNIPFVVKNTRAQVKCPRCGSTNTARILYGMPAFDEELEAKINAGKIHLGGCCITGNDAKCYCNNCKRHFGAPAVIDVDGKKTLITDIVTEIDYSRLVYLDPFSQPHITITKTSDGACVKSSGSINHFPFFNDYNINHKKWKSLVDSLYNDLYLNDWKHRFDNFNVLDGEEWTITIKLSERRKRTYFGMNGYPPYWEEFVKLLKPYLNAKMTNKKERD